jgi:sterol desaturase/sphingolipid hydroxylase (fatty acid hydroxylase superfamily)
VVHAHLATTLAAAVMFGAFVAELLLSRLVLRDQHHDLKDTGINVVIGAGYAVSAAALAALIAGVLGAVWAASPWRWDMRSPGHWLALLLAEDFLYYWSHRASHQLRLMWASHVVHHSSPRLNLSTGMRNSWVGGYLDWVFFLPLPALGFHPLYVAVVQAVATACDFLAHTPYFPRNRLLDLIFNSPSNHRVHHGRNPAYVDKNFGGLLIVWDRLFGTYAAEAAPVSYGTGRMPARPHSPLHLEFQLWVELLRSAVRWRSASRPAARLPRLGVQGFEDSTKPSTQPRPLPAPSQP